MATLTGLYISQSYGGVINLSTNTGIVTGSATQLQDGFGTNLGVWINGQGRISGSAVTSSGDSLINNITVGKGGGNISDNTAVGFQALNSNTGDRNTAIGYQALVSGSTGLRNTAVGYRAANSTTTGQTAVAIGYEAGYSNTTGGENVVIGFQALYSNISSTGNVVIGYQAAYNNDDLTGDNVIIGNTAAYDSLGSSGNTIVGYNTGRGLTTGDSNTVIGANVTGLNPTMSRNIILSDGIGTVRARFNDGPYAGWDFTGGGVAGNTVNISGSTSISGSLYVSESIRSNSVITPNLIVSGGNAPITIYGTSATAMTIGFGAGNSLPYPNTNIAIGSQTLSQADGGKNVAIGFEALKNVCSGSSNNVAIGANALRDMGSNTPYISGSVSGSNIAIGSDVAQSLVGGNGNVMVGDRIARTTTTNGNFNGNTIIGKSSGETFSSGQYNTFVGFSTAGGLNDANSNTIIGARITGLTNSLSNNIILSDGDGNIRARYSGSWTMETALKLTPQNPLPANSVGTLAVSGSNLYYNNGSAWSQIN